MEIRSIRSSQSFLFSNNNKSNSQPDEPAQPHKSFKKSLEMPDSDKGFPDFSAITAEEVRQVAKRGFDHGRLDYDAYWMMQEGLPMHAIDANGTVVDYSSITDQTPFNFRDYYQNQLHVATSIGDPRTVQTLRAVMLFIEAT
jgi:hypothetical protein